MEFHEEKKIKLKIHVHFMDGACVWVFYLSKIYLVYYIIRQENTKFAVSFPSKTMFKFKTIS